MSNIHYNFAVKRFAVLSGKTVNQTKAKITQRAKTKFEIKDAPIPIPLLKLYAASNPPVVIPAKIAALSPTWDFYELDMGVNVISSPGETLKEISYKVVFDDLEKDPQKRARVYDLFPSTKWQDKLTVKGDVEVTAGLDASLQFAITVNPKVDAKAGVKVSALISVPISYTWRSMVAESAGIDSTHADWVLKEKEMVGDIPLMAVIMVRKGSGGIHADFFGNVKLQQGAFGTREVFVYDLPPLATDISLPQ